MLKSRRRLRNRAIATVDRVGVPACFKRKIPVYDLLDDEALDRLEDHAEWLLSEIGIELRDDPVALNLFKDAGATVDGELIRFDRGHVRALCETAPKTFTMHARNPRNNIEFGGDNVIFGPAYGSPFVTDLERGRQQGHAAARVVALETYACRLQGTPNRR